MPELQEEEEEVLEEVEIDTRVVCVQACARARVRVCCVSLLRSPSVVPPGVSPVLAFAMVPPPGVLPLWVSVSCPRHHIGRDAR